MVTDGAAGADGTLSAVSRLRTHLGCQVTFIRAERSRDCPCHGSRFATDGSACRPGGRPTGEQAVVNLSALFPPTLLARLLDDISAIADAARALPRLEREVTLRLDALAAQLEPIRELPAVRAAVASLPGKLDALTEIVAPIQRLADVQREIEALRSLVEAMSLQLQSLEAIRVGIEPLDEDMRSVRDSVDTLEPLIEQVNTRLGAVDGRIDTLRSDLAPLGELADKIPGIG